MFSRRVPFALVLALAPLFLHAAEARAQSGCESSYLSRGDTVLVTGMAAGRDTAMADSIYQEWPTQDGNVYLARGAWSVRLALAQRHFEARVYSEFIYGLVFDAQDEYRVVGLPDGTPVQLQVRLVGTDDWTRYTGCLSSGCTPTAFAAVYGTAPEERLEHYRFTPPTGPASFDLTMTITRRAGEPFVLRHRIWVGSSHDESAAEISADVQFEGLPAGVTVMACTQSDEPTPARRTTWGALRARYRAGGPSGGGK